MATDQSPSTATQPQQHITSPLGSAFAAMQPQQLSKRRLPVDQHAEQLMYMNQVVANQNLKNYLIFLLKFLQILFKSMYFWHAHSHKSGLEVGIKTNFPKKISGFNHFCLKIVIFMFIWRNSIILGIGRNLKIQSRFFRILVIFRFSPILFFHFLGLGGPCLRNCFWTKFPLNFLATTFGRFFLRWFRWSSPTSVTIRPIAARRAHACRTDGNAPAANLWSARINVRLKRERAVPATAAPTSAANGDTLV